MKLENKPIIIICSFKQPPIKVPTQFCQTFLLLPQKVFGLLKLTFLCSIILLEVCLIPFLQLVMFFIPFAGHIEKVFFR